MESSVTVSTFAVVTDEQKIQILISYVDASGQDKET
jgi:hypothetical protein